MWKDHLHHTKAEKLAAIVLILIILFTAIGIVFLSETKNPDLHEQEALTEFQQEAKAFESSMKYVKKTYYKPASFASSTPDIASSLFPFDPNSADSLTFIRLGLKPFMAKIILKYRNKGGRYRKPEDFAKVPYLGKELLEKLIPFIRIEEKTAARTDTFIRKSTPFAKQEKLTEGEAIDLATADTSQIKKIPGVGSCIARSIVNYRNRLGGFYSIDQIRELKNISEASFIKIAKFTRIDRPNITLIAVNKCSIERLMSHPYLNFYQAKAIVELRKKRGKLSGLEEFSLYEEFGPKDIERLRHYLSFTL